VIVDLSFDFWVEIQFRWTGRFPPALIDEIGRQKVEIYKSLKPDPDHEGMLSGSRVINVGKRRFDVLFASDNYQIDHATDTHPLRVMIIDELH